MQRVNASVDSGCARRSSHGVSPQSPIDTCIQFSMTTEPKSLRHHPAISGLPGLIRDVTQGWASRAIARGLRSIVCGMLCASAVADGAQLRLTWQDNSTNELGFRIERSTAGGSFLMIGSTGPDITTYVDSSVADGTAYTYRVCAYNAAGASAYSPTASATTPSASNAAPTISSIAAVSLTSNSSSTPIAFSVGDTETAAGALTVTAASSNTSLLPVSGIVLGGSGSSRTVTLTPASNQSGSASVTLTVSDGVNIATSTFTVTVSIANTAPTISDLGNRTVESGANSGAIAFSVGDSQTAAGSLVVTANSSNQLLVPDANIVLGGSGANRTISLQPAVGQSGVATITVRVSDGLLSASDSFVLTVTAPNTPPTISDIPNQVVASGSSTGSIRFTVGDAQTSASLLTVSAASTNPTLVPASALTLSGSGSTRTLLVQPAAGQSGTATITVTVSDGASTSSDGFVLTVTAPNTAPTITAIPNASIDANTTTSPLLFVVGDAQTPAADLVVTAHSTNLALVPLANIAFGGSGANRSVTVVPAANQAGSAGITVTVSDGQLSTSRSFVVTVIAANTPPTISPIASRTIEANTSTGALSFSVSDAETQADAIMINASSSNTALVSGGGLVVSGSGSTRTVTVTPAPNQIGSTTITISANDGSLSSSMTFVVTVNATATAPTISQISDVALNVNGSTTAIPFSVSHATTPAASLTVTASTSDAVLVPLGGIVLGGSDVNRTVTVTPAAGRVGSATVTIVVSDGTLSASESFLVTVSEVNTAPTISSIADRTINLNRSTGGIAFTIGDSTTPAGSLVVTAATSNPALLPVSSIVFGGSGANRTIIATPVTDKSGVAIVTVSVSDGSLTSSTSFSVIVQGVNAAPTIGSIANQSIGRGGSTGPVGFSVNDLDSPVESLVLTANSSNLAFLPLSGIVFGGTGSARTVSLTPAPGSAGSSTVTVTVSDGSSSASTSFVLSVLGENLSPTITPISNIVLVAGHSSELIPFTVADGETQPGMLVVSASSSNPTLVSNGGIQLSGEGSNRSLRVFPSTGMTGTTAVTLTVSDGIASASTSFIVEVVPSSEAPTISSLANQNLSLGSTGTGPIPFVVGDRVISPELLTVSVNSSNLRLVPLSSVVLGGSGAQRTISITPAAGVTGSATIALSVSNGTKTTSTSFDLTVSALNTAPVISPVPAQSLEMGTSSNAISFLVSDAESPAGTLSVSAVVSDPALIDAAGLSFSGLDSDRALTLTPVSGKTGTATVTLIVSDGELSASTAFTVTVSPKNAPPTITSIGSRSVTMGTTTAAIDFFLGDALTPVEDLAVTATSSNTSLVPNSAIVFGGSGANRWLKATPVAGQTGTTTVTVTVSDGELSTSTSFVLAVTVPNTAPTLVTPSNRSTVLGRSSGAIEFTVHDAETPAGSLIVTALSSNQTLLSNQNIVLGGSGETRTITLMPSSNQMGSVAVTLSVSDGSLVTTGSFVLTITAQSTAPRISDLTNLTTAMNGNVGLTFTVSDAETAPGSLTVTATSQNTVLVPVSNIVFGGSGANRTAIITPATDRSGTAVITFRVSDGTLSTTASFMVVVKAPGNVPTISRLYNRILDANTSTGPIPFVVTDLDTPAAGITVTARSSNPSLVPDASIVLGGGGDSRSVSITPLPSQSGNAMITLTASDGFNSSSSSFFVTVYPVNAAPIISALGDRAIVANGVPEVIGFTVTDADSPAASLVVSGSSSNQGLLPNTSIVLSGEGANRTLTLTPVPGQVGVSTVTVTASDGNLTSSRSFVLSVSADGMNPPPAGEPGTPSDPGTGGPVIEQPGQADILIIRQPADVTVNAGRSTTLEVAAIAAGAVSYQWYAGSRGDMGAPVRGATSAVFTTPELMISSSYWVRITNSTQSAMSRTAVVTVAGGRHAYFGTVGLPGPYAGGFALQLNADNTGVFLADSPALARGVVSRGFAIGSNGAFTFDAPGVGTVNGYVNGTSVSGTIGTGLVPFSGSIEPTDGPLADNAGLYQGALINTADDEIVSLVGASGNAFVAVSKSGIARGRQGTVSSDGVLAVTLSDGRAIGLDFESGLLSGTVADGGRTFEVSGARDTMASATQVSNMSVRAQAGNGAATLTAGFTISGTGTKKILLRATGPALEAYGVTGVLADPVLTVFRQGAGGEATMMASNNDWDSSVVATSISVGAFPLPAGSKDAALVMDLPPGGYSAQISGAEDATGATLVEVYDGDAEGSSGSKLSNLSLRGMGGSGDQVIVTGFIVSGNAPRRMLVRAVGPELAGFGVDGSMSNPEVSLFRTKDGVATEIARNDDWSENAELVARISGKVGAFPMTPGSRSAAVVVWLAPGTYTAHARSADNTNGIVIVEVYEVP